MEVQGYERDEFKVKAGAPIKVGKNDDGTSRIAVVRPLNSYAYEDRLTALRKANGRAWQRDAELDRELQIQALADKVLVKIVGFKRPDGTPIDDTRENRIELLRGGAEDADRDLLDRTFFMEIISAAGEAETFAKERVEADLGNSPSTSSGG